MPNLSTQPLVRMSGIGKRFGRVPVLQDVSFEIYPGEVHVLAGENGAGKSTLIKILAGVHSDYEGTIEIEGKLVRPGSPLEAAALGVAVIHQELSLVPSMSVADNIFLGRSPTRVGFVNDRAQRAEAKRLLDQLGVEVEVDRPVGALPIATQQLIEITKALSQNAKVIVMDEPTSALNAPEVERLFRLINDLKERGCGIVYITHRMEEIERIADRITVLRDGHLIGSAPASRVPIPTLIRWMVGRELERWWGAEAVGSRQWAVERQGDKEQRRQGAEKPTPPLATPPPRLTVEDFSIFTGGRGGRPVVDSVSLSVRVGEILGIAGLQGSGASELLMGLFGGYGGTAHGRVLLNGKPIRIRSPQQAIENGIALLTNDRKATGLVLSLSVIANATLADLNHLSPGGWRRPNLEREATITLAESLRLRTASLEMAVGELSGGNQQKVALAKWLQTRPQVLLLDEPTRGIDVGAKREIYDLMNQWTAQGISILLITSEMPELLAMSDRIIVMHRGKVTAEFTRDHASADAILEAAMGKPLNLYTAE